MFSFNKKGAIKAIAQIHGGKQNNDILYLHRKEPDTKIAPPYFDNIELPKGSKFSYFPDMRPNFSDSITLSGKKGTGKSTLASEMAMKIKHELDLDDDDVIVFKKSEVDDPAFKKLNPQYFYVNAEFEENPPTIDEICADGKPKIVICDDLDSIQSNKLKRAWQEFNDSLLREQRKYKCYTIICTHRLAGGKDTKAMLTESDYIVFFPHGTTSDIKYALQRYCDLSLDFIRDLKKANSHWVFIHNQNPVFILTETRAFIFDFDRESDRLAIEKDDKKEERTFRRALMREEDEE